MNTVAIIIPTYDNRPYLEPCVKSILLYSQGAPFHIYVVNNGAADSCDWLDDAHVTVLQAGGNLGWQGGLKLGLSQVDAPYVLFLNDDTLLPPCSGSWLNQLLAHFDDPKVGAVGPSSNVAGGPQAIFNLIPYRCFGARFLIGFCMLLRHQALLEVGGVDDALPSGDDIDISIRLRKRGYTLVVDRSVFVYHHGFVTGTRVYGGPEVANGWNSAEYSDTTREALIAKHGLWQWWDAMRGIGDPARLEPR